MGNFTRLVTLSALIVLPAISLFAWDDTGHKTMAYIAWQQMSPTARDAVIKILKSAPEDSNLSAFYLNGAESQSTRQLEYFMLVATWADILRDRTFENRNKKYHKSNWHYDDTFWKQVNGKAEILPNAEEGMAIGIGGGVRFQRGADTGRVPGVVGGVGLPRLRSDRRGRWFEGPDL